MTHRGETILSKFADAARLSRAGRSRGGPYPVLPAVQPDFHLVAQTLAELDFLDQVIPPAQRPWGPVLRSAARQPTDLVALTGVAGRAGLIYDPASYLSMTTLMRPRGVVSPTAGVRHAGTTWPSRDCSNDSSQPTGG